jgi:hypothetical protein
MPYEIQILVCRTYSCDGFSKASPDLFQRRFALFSFGADGRNRHNESFPSLYSIRNAAENLHAIFHLKFLSILSVLVFGGDRFAAAFNRRAERVPRKTRAFDAGGEFADAGEDFQAAQMVLFGFGVEVAFLIRKSLRVQLIRLQDNFFVR